MNFLKDDIRKIYRKYLIPTLGSALAMSIYSFVDTIAVGQYAGSAGSAAIAVINPIYNIMVVIGFLCSTGGSVRFGNAVGQGKQEKGNAYFTASMFLCILLTCAVWIFLWLRLPEVLTFFGADKTVLPYALDYGKWIVRFFPVIVAPDFMAPFIRMDKEPKRAMAAVMTGGGLNMFLDWFLVFPMKMGMAGAAIATVTGTVLQCLIMLSHFISKKNTLRFVLPYHPLKAAGKVVAAGASASLLDLGNVFLGIMMNRQMLAYGGSTALGIYGVVNTIAILCQALFAGVGQTIQPGVSVNHGAGDHAREDEFYHLGVKTVLMMGCFFTLIGEAFPSVIVRIFMSVTPDVLKLTPFIMRLYFLCFPFMGFCVLISYYLQSVLRPKASSLIALMRSIILPAVLVFTLPRFSGLFGVCIAIPLSEGFTAALALWEKKASNRGQVRT